MKQAALQNNAAPLVDVEMIKTFAAVIFGYVEGPVAIRILTEKGQPSDTPWVETHPAGDHLAEEMVRLARRAATAGRALYVVPATLKKTGPAKAGNIAETAVLLVDLDEGSIEDKRRLLIETLGPATLTVASGGLTKEGARKLHLYWRLTEAASGDDLEKIARLRETLATKVGGDTSFKRMTQPIRVAGSLHCKSDPSRLVEILEKTNAEIDLAEAEQRVNEMINWFEPEKTHCGATNAAPSLSLPDLKVKRIRSEGRDGITRYEALSRIVGHWIRRARLGEVTLGEAWAAVQDHNASQIDPPWDIVRLKREFGALHRRDVEANQVVWAGSLNKSSSPGANSDDALADTFVAKHGDDWRFSPAENVWRGWSGEAWRPDRLNLVSDLVRLVCRERAMQCDKPGEAQRIASAKTIQAVLRIASTDPRITLAPDAFDAHPMMLNTPGGVINLETGEIQANRRDLHLSILAGASPGGDRTRWTEFLGEITGGDGELIGYLKRLAGYCLTGATSEQAFFFLHGAGANGKSVFLDTLANALGGYARTAPFETFAATSNASHPTDLAGLKGARLVLVTETDQGRDWAESRIKAATGGEPIAARFMRGDFFEYRPAFKLIVAGNHRPGLRSFGEAMRRRLHMVPFDITIPRERRDRNLQEKLKVEAGGVLSWMIEGCGEWRERGLDPPERIRAAAHDYFTDEDLVGQWIAEHCVVGRDKRSAARDLYTNWKAFADAAGHPVGSSKQLGGELRSRGFTQVRTGSARGWSGIAIARSGSPS